MIEYFNCNNLRCFDKKECFFNNNFTLIEGKNGTGKTTILEGIYLSIRGRSFLTGKLGNLVKIGEDFLKLETGVDGNVIKVLYSYKNGKQILFNERKESFTNISLNFPLFVFNAKLLNFIRSDLITLYKFFNIILSLYDKSYLKAYREYIKALKQKRSLLTLYSKYDTINAWNLVISERSKIIREKRKEFVKKINKLLNNGNLISYKEHSLSLDENSVFKRELKEKKVLTGCHRDRYFILKDNKDMRFFYSSGQQKNIFFDVLKAIGKVFAEKTGKKPVLLLDDFDSELDSSNLYVCLSSVLQSFQIILTTTDRKRFYRFDYNLISL